MSDTAWRESRKALLAYALRTLSGVRCLWRRPPPERQTIYYANHTSHLDALLIWACLPDAVRNRTRPVAAGDYWRRKGLREYFAAEVFNAVFVERTGGFNRGGAERALTPLHDALDRGIASSCSRRGPATGVTPSSCPSRAASTGSHGRILRSRLSRSGLKTSTVCFPRAHGFPCPFCAA